MMRIELLKTSPDRSGRYSVRFDDGSMMRLYRNTVEEFGLYSGMEMDARTYEQLCMSASEMSARMRAVRIISATNVSVRDLKNRLVQKGEDPVHAEHAVEWLEDLHLVDDRNTAEQIVHSCVSRGYGIGRAKQMLYEKRIPKEYWDDALMDYPDQSDRIQGFLKSRLDHNSDSKEIKKAIDSLIRRGHSYGVVRKCLSELSFESEDIPEVE